MKSKMFSKIKEFVDGDISFEVKEKEPKKRRPTTHKEKTIAERYVQWHDENSYNVFRNFYVVISAIIAVCIISVLLITVSYTPPFGNPDNPVNNEVTQRYIENGMQETGAVNIIAGVILDYRAFDTFGEACVLFVAACSVIMLMEKDKKGKNNNFFTNYDPKRDMIVKGIAKLLIPFNLVLGVYIVLNGHLSPGGGFSGGAIMGASLILFSSAFGYRKIKTIFSKRVIKFVTFFSLSFYAIAKGYSFFTGANHIESGISTGVPGNIISAGLILPLNIAVGLVVTMTMYSFYALFTREEI